MTRKRGLLAAAALAAVATAGCSLPTATTDQPSGSPTAAFTAADAAAVIGLGTLVAETPPVSKDADALKQFLGQLADTKKAPKTPKADLGFLGNTLVAYTVSSKGGDAPVCYTVKPPADVEPTAKQATWAVYNIPATDSTPGVIALGAGVTDCPKAQQLAETVSKDAAQAASVTQASVQLLISAYKVVPYSQLTPGALQLLDTLRSNATS